MSGRADSCSSRIDGLSVFRQVENEGRKLLLVSDSGLAPLQARPSLRKYLKGLWDRRAFIGADARAKAFSNSRGKYLGPLWIILDPLIQVAVYALIFGAVLKISRGMDNYIGFLVIGVVMFGFFSRALTGAVGLMQATRDLVSSFPFPKAAVCISLTLRQFIDNAIPFIVAIFVAYLFEPEVRLNASVLLIVPVYFLVHLFNLGSGMIITRITAFYPDLKSIINVSVRGLFFVSGVFFSIERFSTEPLLEKVMLSNPIYQFFLVTRLIVLEGEVAPLASWIYIFFWSISIGIAGLVFFWRAEERYINVF